MARSQYDYQDAPHKDPNPGQIKPLKQRSPGSICSVLCIPSSPQPYFWPHLSPAIKCPVCFHPARRIMEPGRGSGVTIRHGGRAGGVGGGGEAWRIITQVYTTSASLASISTLDTIILHVSSHLAHRRWFCGGLSPGYHQQGELRVCCGIKEVHISVVNVGISFLEAHARKGPSVNLEKVTPHLP